MTANNNAARPDIRAYIGQTGSGKGVSVRAHLEAERPQRLIIWDPLGEYGGFVELTTDKIADVAKMAGRKSFRVAYWPGADIDQFKEKFALFCRVVFAAGNCTMLVEELADVTSPSYAPVHWKYCTTKGRHRQLKIIACSQRPAQVDKDFLGGCTYVRCFMLRYKPDRKAMSDSMDVPFTDIAELTTVEQGNTTTINYLERDFRMNKTTKGTIKKTRKKGAT